jgi:hypothetical protein
MHSEFTKVQFTGQHVYVGIDVARRSWKVCIYVGQLYHKRCRSIDVWVPA